MKYQFRIVGDPEVKLQHVKCAAAKKGIRFQGNGAKGKFAGAIGFGNLIGSYKVDVNNIITVSITEKPCLATWPMIEQQLRQFLEG